MSNFPLLSLAKNNNLIEIYVDKSLYFGKQQYFNFYINDKFICKVSSKELPSTDKYDKYEIQLDNNLFIPGEKYEISTSFNDFVGIDISFLSRTKEFEKQYRFSGQLGSIYTKEFCEFRIFSPFASSIIVKVFDDSGFNRLLELDHDKSNGIFYGKINGDLKNKKYIYIVTMFSRTFEVVDPYCLSCTTNNKYGYIIDKSEIKNLNFKKRNLSKLNNKCEAIIYECNVRDLTSRLNIKSKGTFKALIDSIDKDYGIGYIKTLGINYVQFQPILDYQTINDDNPFDSYNWGYDPRNFFAIKSSLSSNPNDPVLKLKEFKELVSIFHSLDIHVSLDVVYNHLFSKSFNSLNLLVPGYYFRYNADGSNSNGSFCGNDFETRNYMARKIIIDSLKYFVDVFDIDGFRFDLLGLFDIETSKSIFKELSSIKDNIFLYGEGWDLPTALSYQDKSSMSNSRLLENYSFFNDRFRDIIKGGCGEFKACTKGYLTGDTSYIDGFKHVMLGSSTNYSFQPLLYKSYQSINYCQCHDNETLYDKIKLTCPEESKNDIYSRLKMCIIATLFACGIPYFQSGQEIANTKNGSFNSYNLSDSINGFDYDLLKKNSSFVQFFRDSISIKKMFISDANEDYSTLTKTMHFENLQFGAVKITYKFSNVYYHIIFNPTMKSFILKFEKYVKLILSNIGKIKTDEYCLNAIINPLSVYIYKENLEAVTC